jgi:hypothetical protein
MCTLFIFPQFEIIFTLLEAEDQEDHGPKTGQSIIEEEIS